MIEPYDLPDDMIGIILEYYHEFQVADMADRMHEFRSHYAMSWGQIMEEICSTPQFYRIYIQTYDDTHFSIPLNLPLCDFAGFASLANFNAWVIIPKRIVSHNFS